MQAVRLLLAQRHLALLICAAALLLKLIVPAGYMIGTDHGRAVITLCPDAAPLPSVSTHTAGMHKGGHDAPKDHGKPELPCAFAGLSAAMLGAIDPVLLVALIAFVLASGLAAIAPPPLQPAHLRPPSHGPPARL